MVIRSALITRRDIAAIPKFRSSVRLALSIFTSEKVSSLDEAAGGAVDSGLLAVAVAILPEKPVNVEDGGNVVVELSMEGPLDVAPADS